MVNPSNKEGGGTMSDSKASRAKSELRFDTDTVDVPTVGRTVIDERHLAEKAAEEAALNDARAAEELARLEGIISPIVRDYARQLDTNADYITREQVRQRIAEKTGIREDGRLDHLTRRVFVSLGTGSDATSGRIYRLHHSPDGLHQDDWLALPSVRTRFSEWSREYPYYIDVVVEQASDPKPYPSTPSAEAWKRWEAAMTELMFYMATSPKTICATEDELVSLVVAFDVPPNSGDGVTPNDIAKRSPAIVDAAFKRAMNEGYTILTSPVGLRLALPKMTPRKRF